MFDVDPDEQVRKERNERRGKVAGSFETASRVHSGQ